MASSSGRFPVGALLTMSAAVFVSMCNEFLPGGLIPDIARDLSTPVPVVGQLISIFALTVVVSTIPLTIVTRRVPRKAVLLIALATIAVSNVLAAAAPTFALLAASRVVGGLAHGLFWAVVAAYAAQLVGTERLGRAMVIMSVGGSVASIAGIPLGNALGHAFGWRAAFTVLAVLSVVIGAVIAGMLPPVANDASAEGGAHRATLPHRDRSLAVVIGVCVLIVLVVVGQQAMSTYAVVWLEDVPRFDPAAVPFALAVLGVTGTVGLVVTGFATDRFPRGALIGFLALHIVALCLLGLAGGSGSKPAVIAALALWGFAFGGIPAALQVKNMRVASPGIRSFASALQATAFNVGIGVSAALGGLVIQGGGLTLLPYVAAIFALATAVCLVLGERRARSVEASSEDLASLPAQTSDEKVENR